MSMVFCRGCGKEIHKTALACPHCGAPQAETSTPDTNKEKYTNYEQVPWYRTNWFAILSFFIIPPFLFLVLVTGDIYYEKKGKLLTYSKVAKFLLIFWTIGYMLSVLSKVN